MIKVCCAPKFGRAGIIRLGRICLRWRPARTTTTFASSARRTRTAPACLRRLADGPYEVQKTAPDSGDRAQAPQWTPGYPQPDGPACAGQSSRLKKWRRPARPAWPLPRECAASIRRGLRVKKRSERSYFRTRIVQPSNRPKSAMHRWIALRQPWPFGVGGTREDRGRYRKAKRRQPLAGSPAE